MQSYCPDLDQWPGSWAYEPRDIPPGLRMVECFKPFLREMLSLSLSRQTLRRHRDNIWVLGGEVIRRLQMDSSLRRRPIQQVVLELIDDDGGRGQAPQPQGLTAIRRVEAKLAVPSGEAPPTKTRGLNLQSQRANSLVRSAPRAFFRPDRQFSQPPCAGTVKAGRGFRGHPKGLALIGPAHGGILDRIGPQALAELSVINRWF